MTGAHGQAGRGFDFRRAPRVMVDETVKEGGVMSEQNMVTPDELNDVEALDSVVRAADEETSDSHSARARLRNKGVTLLPRLVRAHRRVCAERDSGIPTDDLVGSAVAKAEQDAYRRGRREAIEEAARYLRAFSKEATSNGLEDTAATLDAAAEGIENHESELTKGHARGE